MTDPAPVNVALAGLGRAGWNIHARTIRRLPDKFRVAAAFDGLPGRRAQAAAELGCRVCERYDELLTDPGVELVVIAAPTQLHADWTVQALEAGKDVLCEKPVARDLAECDRMAEAQRRTGRRLVVFQNRRFTPAFRKVREVAASGALGELVLVRSSWCMYRRRWDWQTVRGLGGGALRNAGAHFLDLVMEFSGSAEPAVSCHLARVLASGDAEDFVKLVLSAPDAPLLEVDIFANCAIPQPEWLVLGRRGSLVAGEREASWRTVRGFESLPRREVDLSPVADRSYSQEKLEFDEFSWRASPDELDYDRAFYEALHAALRGGAALPVGIAEVRRRMAIIDRCLREGKIREYE